MKLKRWEIALIAAVVIAVVAGTWLNAEARELSGKLVRLHVVANSDSEEDQALKLRVRDAVLKELAPKLEGVTDAKTAREIIAGELDNIERTAENLILAEGGSFSVSAELAVESFPTTEYETFALPAGRYTALRVRIGEGAGHNWWCVVFPGICGAAAQEDAASAAIGLEDDEISLVTRDGTEYEVRFRLLELWGRFLSLFD